ncbi:hypothetical protein [Desulfosporosinus metallidurans]|uniref:Uncharacterized protein n=1 Tax=Desulfosporosinus metallidurans TaxID=1888891 RepID=A0A1Q8QNV7_9FIRM|nr:hypothetical protein [Desulfosporosinus metallidurans]OLN28978.1 hypothetical protein DSOL_3789 [Desulfosporosinus metallidurans]
MACNIKYDIAKEIAKVPDELDRMYKRVKSLYTSLLGAENFRFDVSQYSYEEQKQFIKLAICLIDSEENLIGEKSLGIYPNRKLISNLNKYNTDFKLDKLANEFYCKIPQ